MKKLGIYIHIPFCVSKCGYCGFNSVAVSEGSPLIEKYANALLAELEYVLSAVPEKYVTDSIFFGGGTPSMLKAEQVLRLIDLIAGHKNSLIADDAEITLEANPKTFSAEKIGAYAEAGINRLSIGAQSMTDLQLDTLGRSHTSSEFVAAYEYARNAGINNINVDLMLGIPRQTERSFKNSLHAACKLLPEHISCYSLELEEGTQFYERYAGGEFSRFSFEKERRIYHEACEILAEYGYEHYEISNFALKGRKCRHNLKYWDLCDWIGVGVSAHSYIGNTYSGNIADITAYIAGMEKGKIRDVVEHSAENDKRTVASDFVLMGLRKAEGIRYGDFRKRVGDDFFEIFPDAAAFMKKYAQCGLLEIDSEGLRLTKRGIDMSSDILSEFL